MEIIYLERLTLAWLKANQDALKSRTLEVFFIDHDGPALSRARALCVHYPLTFEECRFKYAELKGPDGVSLRLKATYEGLLKMGDLIARGLPPVDKGLALYLLKAPLVTHDLYTEGKYLLLRQAITLIHIVRWHVDKAADSSRDMVELHLFQRPFSQELVQYAISQGIRLRMMEPGLVRHTSWRNMTRKFFKLNPRVLQSLLRHSLSAGPQAPGSSSTQAKLLAEARLEFNIEDGQRSSDVFFMDKDGGICGKDLLLVFNGTFNQVNEEKLKVMQKHDIQAVALSPQSSLVSTSKVGVFSLKPDQTASSLYLHGFSGDYLPFGMAYARSRHYWDSFFRRYNVRLWTTFYKNEAEHIAMADALKALGGISAMYQRSYESHPCLISAAGTDIIFSFSAREYDIERLSRSNFRYHVATGYLGDYRFEHLRPMAARLRKTLTGRGAKYILAYFDENTIEDGRWFFDHSFVKESYAFWLEKLLANPELGLIFKPKVPQNLRARLGKISRLMDRAVATGRCYVFKDFLSPPAAAAMASDMAIQESLAGGTAAVEAALAGTRTVLMDFEGWPLSPLYQLGPDVVFKDFDHVWEACANFFKDPGSSPALGDWSAIIHELDPFRDGRAAQRMSWYLKQLLEGLRRAEPRDDLMERVAEQYARQWGKDKVKRGPEN